MIAFTDRHDVLTICKFRFEAFSFPRNIMFFVWLTMLHIKKLMGMHNKETYTRVYMRICVRIYSYMCAYWHVYAKYTRMLCVCIVCLYLTFPQVKIYSEVSHFPLSLFIVYLDQCFGYFQLEGSCPEIHGRRKTGGASNQQLHNKRRCKLTYTVNKIYT